MMEEPPEPIGSGHFVFDGQEDRRVSSSQAGVNICGFEYKNCRWRLQKPFALIMLLSNLQNLNGRPFLFNGFAWDYGGVVNSWDGGKRSERKTGNRVDTSTCLRLAYVKSFELPLAQADRSPRYLSSGEYYALRVRPVYRGYPVYFPGREPVGYLDSLRQTEPEIIFDPSSLRTEVDWIRAGELVFKAPASFIAVTDASEADRHAYFRAAQIHFTREGITPYFQYVVRKKGVLELGTLSCAHCHTRVMPDGTAFGGAQGDDFFASRAAWIAGRRGSGPEQERRIRGATRLAFGAPWAPDSDDFENLTIAEYIRRQMAMQPGVIPRQGSSGTHPPKIPSLIGIKEIRYLDSTGLVRHRSIGDLMRYAIVNQGLDITAHFGAFQPASNQTLSAEDGTRYSDEQLYALALYLYSLKPPPNPNATGPIARGGESVFLKNRVAQVGSIIRVLILSAKVFGPSGRQNCRASLLVCASTSRRPPTAKLSFGCYGCCPIAAQNESICLKSSDAQG